MKILLAIAVILAAVLAWFIYASAGAQRRGQFVHFLNDVKEGQMELRTCGAITNQFMRSRVYPCTNSFVVAGTNYQCEVCADRDEFKSGTLAITTNGVWLWIDRKRGAIPLIGRLFPPGV